MSTSICHGSVHACKPIRGWIATPHIHNEALAQLAGPLICADHVYTNEIQTADAIDLTCNDHPDGGWNGENFGPILLNTLNPGSSTDDSADLIYRAGRLAQERRRQRTPLPVLETPTVYHKASIHVVVTMEESSYHACDRSSLPRGGIRKCMKRALGRVRRKLECFSDRNETQRLVQKLRNDGERHEEVSL